MTPTPPTELPKLVGVWTMSQYTTEEPSKGYTKVSVHSLLEEIELKLEQASCLLEDECDNEDISVCKFELDTMVKKLREARR